MRKRNLTSKNKQQVYCAQVKGKAMSAKDTATEPKEYDYIIYTDGGCAYNPGGPGACASVIINLNTSDIKEIVNGYRSTTNNRMEIRAIIQGLEEISKNKKILIISDSQYAINCATGIWSKKKNTDLWKRFTAACAGKYTDFKWVRGHDGNTYNERCDLLCTERMDIGPLAEDIGYRSLPERVNASKKMKPFSSLGGAMAVRINVPSTLTRLTPVSSDKKLKPDCAKSINRLNANTKPSFKDFKDLKTCGIDDFSRLSKDNLVKICGDDEFAYIGTFFAKETNHVSAARWFARGLTLEYAIRKELVSIEIANNIR